MNLHIVTISYSVNFLNVKIKLGMDINYTMIMNDYKYIFFPMSRMSLDSW